MTGSVLFHFAPTEDALYGILRENFKPSFAKESIFSKLNNYEGQFAAPMVSFSDMRLSEVKEFKFPYGEYGIGMSKKWAVKNHLCAIMYAEKNSTFMDTYTRALIDFFYYIESSKESDAKLLSMYNRFLNGIRYIKPYQADLERKGKKTIKNYCFANEREWRYVVPLEATDYPFLMVDKLDEKGKAYWNAKIENNRLVFTPDDIRYLIVPTEADILPLVRYISTVKVKYSYEAVQKLRSRILTVKQIKDDF